VIDTLLFDFDGTLANTYPIIFFAFQSIFKQFKNHHITGPEIVALFGPAEDEIIRTQFDGHADVPAILERYYELYDAHHDVLVKPTPEINHMLNQFKERGYKLGIITGKGRRSLNISLRHLIPEDIFDVTIAGDEVTQPKPHPEGVLKAMQTLASPPEKTIFIGDSDFDFKAGKAAGVKTVGVSWFDENEKIIWAEQPDIYLKKTAHLLQSFE
jgi:phosphoglycolate phosphatase/pyrophosphatase PpaX